MTVSWEKHQCVLEVPVAHVRVRNFVLLNHRRVMALDRLHRSRHLSRLDRCIQEQGSAVTVTRQSQAEQQNPDLREALRGLRQFEMSGLCSILLRRGRLLPPTQTND